MPKKVTRDAGTGKFVDAEQAIEHPETTVTETIRSRKVTTLELEGALRVYSDHAFASPGDHEGALEAALNSVLGGDE